ncbi:hypothetical protein AM1_A0305 (plasmid) [Acaryochloris marina MBIC11017]|uniref:Uncharacterized protein n=1 Tax=Acaryochloris marina (strain MBIC 11017) TaxID=329726 RepID=A8ZKV5_ACAM1|nr:hypothetical protein [Acaryochloris marina]ABW31423.1 hypothetical protein AM1_A0305 [Acaryochloris marina MBIC11017]BDM83479.1 hypothetical protein AM10699_63400 [Acaryochloris marina MBIC10699]
MDWGIELNAKHQLYEVNREAPESEDGVTVDQSKGIELKTVMWGHGQ